MVGLVADGLDEFRYGCLPRGVFIKRTVRADAVTEGDVEI